SDYCGIHRHPCATTKQCQCCCGRATSRKTGDAIVMCCMCHTNEQDDTETSAAGVSPPFLILPAGIRHLGSCAISIPNLYNLRLGEPAMRTSLLASPAADKGQSKDQDIKMHIVNQSSPRGTRFPLHPPSKNAVLSRTFV
ncbi:unnamed protein product, partial [Ectocarpus sp. 12 AP-2014]